jgi:RHS repeat-associated protein
VTFYRYRHDRQEWQALHDATLNVTLDGNVHILQNEYKALYFKYVWALAYRYKNGQFEVLSYGAAGADRYRPNWTRIGFGACGEFGEPINIVTGHMVRDEPDVALRAPGLGLHFKRTYNSGFDLPAGSLGPRWCHSFEWSICHTNHIIEGVNRSITNDCLKVRTGGGRQLTLNRVGSGEYWENRAENSWSATATSEGGYELKLPGQVTYSFTSNGVLTHMEDGRQNRVTLDYAGGVTTGILSRVEHTNGQYLHFTYHANRLVRVDTPTALSVLFAYDGQGVLTNAVRSSSCRTEQTTYQYSTIVPHALTEVTDPRGDVLHYGYDSDSLRCTSVVMNANSYPGFVVTGAYDNAIRTIAVRDDTNLVREYEYDPDSLRIQSISTPGCVGSSTIYRQDEYENVRRETCTDNQNPAAFTDIRRTFDTQHQLKEESFGYGNDPAYKWQYTWNSACQRLASVTDPENHRTTFSYRKGSLSEVRQYYSAGGYYATKFGYAQDGVLTGVTNANGHRVTYHNDRYGFMTSCVPQLGPAIHYERDRMGNLLSIALPGRDGPRITHFDTDERGQINGITYPDGSIEQFFYDGGGNLTNHVDALGRATHYERTDAGQLLSATRTADGTSSSIRFTYDNWFNTRQVRGADNRVVESYDLDGENRPVLIRNIEGQAMSLQYVMKGWVDSVRRFDGSTVSNTYDTSGRLLEIRHPDDTLHFAYLRNGLLKSVSHNTGGTSNTYDLVNRLVSSKGSIPHDEITYSYRPAGKIATVSSAAGTHSYSYDAAERVISIDGAEGTYEYEYDPLNGLVSTVRCAVAGVVKDQQYDVRDQLSRITYRDRSGNVLREFRYSRNAVGQITNVTRASGERVEYVYDPFGRLIGEKHVSKTGHCTATESYAYDAVGNRTRKTHGDLTLEYSHPYGNSGNRMAGWRKTQGNQTVCADITKFSAGDSGACSRYAEVLGGGGPRATVFMLGGRSTRAVKKATGEVQILDPGGTPVTISGAQLKELSKGTYLHSAAGCVTNVLYEGPAHSRAVSLRWNGKYQLTSLSTDGTCTERYGYDPLGRRAWVSLGPATNYMIYAGSHVIAEVDAAGSLRRSYTYGPGTDNLLAMTTYTSSETNAYFFLTDHQGSVHAITDDRGEIVEQYRYDAWGNVTVFDSSGTPMMQSAVGNRHLWHGREYSWATGLYYFRARWYDPVTGRWLSKDPIGIAGGLNQYVFCYNNPVTYRDPSGEFGLIGAGIGGLVGGVIGGAVAAWNGNSFWAGAAGGAVAGAFVGSGAGIVAAAVGAGTISGGTAIGAMGIISASGSVVGNTVQQTWQGLESGQSVRAAIGGVDIEQQRIAAASGLAAGVVSGGLLVGGEVLRQASQQASCQALRHSYGLANAYPDLADNILRNSSQAVLRNGMRSGLSLWGNQGLQSLVVPAIETSANAAYSYNE